QLRLDRQRLDEERREANKARNDKADNVVRKPVVKAPRDTPLRPRNKEPKSSGNPGYLTMNASPYATVFVDGKKQGITPIVKLKLKPGKHKIKLVSSGDGKTKTMSVTIQSDDVLRKNVQF